MNADSVSSGRSIVGANVFQYCLNNPTTLHDPSGLWPVSFADLANDVNKAFGFKTTAAIEGTTYDFKQNYFFARYSHVEKTTTSSSVGVNKPVTIEKTISNTGVKTSLVFNDKSSSIAFSNISVLASNRKGLNTYSYKLSYTNIGFGLFKTVSTKMNSNTSSSTTLGFEIDMRNIALSAVAVVGLVASPATATLTAIAEGGDMVYRLFSSH